MTDTRPDVLTDYFGPSHFAGRPDPTGTARPYYDRPARAELAARLAQNMGQSLPPAGSVRAGFLAAAKELQAATSDRAEDHAGLLDAIDRAFAADDWLRGKATYPGAVVQPVAQYWHKHRPRATVTLSYEPDCDHDWQPDGDGLEACSRCGWARAG